MFNIGGGEALVIALIALIVLGPQRLPDAARQVGRAMGELRRLSSGFQTELKAAFEEAERDQAAPPPRDVLADEAGPTARRDGEGRAARRPRRRTPLRADPVADDEASAPPR